MHLPASQAVALIGPQGCDWCHRPCGLPPILWNWVPGNQGAGRQQIARGDQSARPLKVSETMAYVITDACVKDFLCAAECPTNAVHPTSDEAGADSVTQLFINPDECIDCGNCISVCPSNAIFPIDELPADKAAFTEKNAAHFH